MNAAEEVQEGCDSRSPTSCRSHGRIASARHGALGGRRGFSASMLAKANITTTAGDATHEHVLGIPFSYTATVGLNRHAALPSFREPRVDLCPFRTEIIQGFLVLSMFLFSSLQYATWVCILRISANVTEHSGVPASFRVTSGAAIRPATPLIAPRPAAWAVQARRRRLPAPLDLHRHPRRRLLLSRQSHWPRSEAR